MYNSDTLMFKIPESIGNRLQERTGLAIMPVFTNVQNKVFRVVDEVNIFRIKKNLLDGNLKIYNLRLSKNDLNHMDNISIIGTRLGYMDKEMNNWRNATLEFENQRYKVEVKLHGDVSEHWSRYLKSYKIKTERSNYVNNMRKFTFIIFEDRLLEGRLTNIIAKDLGLVNIRDDIVVLKINGVVQGLYYLREDFDKNFLENNKCSNCEVIKTTDNWIEDHPKYGEVSYPYGIMYSESHYTAFDYEVSNVDFEKSDLDKEKILYSTQRLFDSIKNKDTNILLNYIDLDYISSFEALRAIIADPHFITGDNLNLIYSAANSKFYPIPQSELLLRQKVQKGGFEHNMNLYFGQIYVDLFYMLTQNHEIRQLRNKKLYNYIKYNKERLLNKIEEEERKFLPYAVSYKTNAYNRRYIQNTFRKYRDIISYNMDIISNVLEYSKSYIGITQKSNNLLLEVIPDSISQIKFTEFKINLSQSYTGDISIEYWDESNQSIQESVFIENPTNIIDLTEKMNSFNFAAGLDKDLFPIKRTYPIRITFENEINVENVQVEMTNDITNRSINKNDIYIQLTEGNEYEQFYDLSYSEFVKKYSQFNWEFENGNLILKRGKYNLNTDLIIPRPFQLVIEQGTEISIAEGKSIVVYGAVNISGTSKSPIIIRAQNPNNPFGTFGIVGDNTLTTNIDWLHISGGSEKFINGIYFQGALSIHNMKEVILTNSNIYQNWADDGLNIKYANVRIDNNKFYDNFADQFDCDFCQGIIKNSDFTAPSFSSGDGLDFSGSRIIVKNNEFKDFKDKGVSIGEESKAILYNNILNNNNISIAVKDLSHAYLFDNKFNNNNIAVTAYQKKQLFGEGYSYIYNNQFELNKQNFTLDKKSKIFNLRLNPNTYKKIIIGIDQENLDKVFEPLDNLSG